MSAVIRFENVSKRYRIGSGRESLREALYALPRRLLRRGDGALDNSYIWALKDVGFEAHKGEVLGLIGSNGAGKTTILKLLSGVTRPTKGKTQVDGRMSALIELGAGFHPDLTGRENVYLNGAILGLGRKEIEAKYDSIVEFAELERFMDTPVKRYSSGMYARLGFSVAIHVNPDVLLVDEVLAVGDISFQKKCWNRMRDMMKRGSKAIVLVSHNMNAIKRLCSRVIWLENGAIRDQGSTRRIVDRYVEEQLSGTAGDGVLDITGQPLRYGDGKAVVQAVSLHNQFGDVCDHFTRRDRICVRIQYMAYERIEPVQFVVTLANQEGVKVAGSTSSNSLADASMALSKGTGTIECVFDPIPLAPGVYYIIAAIEGRGGTLDRRGMLGPLIIQSEDDREHFSGVHGFLSVDSTWSKKEDVED